MRQDEDRKKDVLRLPEASQNDRSHARSPTLMEDSLPSVAKSSSSGRASSKTEEPPARPLTAEEVGDLKEHMKTFAEHLTMKHWPMPDAAIIGDIVRAGNGAPISKITEFLKNEALRKSPRGGNVNVTSYGFAVKLVKDQFGAKP